MHLPITRLGQGGFRRKQFIGKYSVDPAKKIRSEVSGVTAQAT
jgi:hypothetical protein